MAHQHERGARHAGLKGIETGADVVPIAIAIGKHS